MGKISKHRSLENLIMTWFNGDVNRKEAKALSEVLISEGYIHKSESSKVMNMVLEEIKAIHEGRKIIEEEKVVKQTKWSCGNELFKLVGYDAMPPWRYKAKIRKYIVRLVDKWEGKE